MLEHFLTGRQVQDRDGTLQRVATVTSGLSGAHLRELVDTVNLELLGSSRGSDPVGLADFKQALTVLRATRSDVGFR
jgi:hypothetical protein